MGREVIVYLVLSITMPQMLSRKGFTRLPSIVEMLIRSLAAPLGAAMTWKVYYCGLEFCGIQTRYARELWFFYIYFRDRILIGT